MAANTSPGGRDRGRVERTAMTAMRAFNARKQSKLSRQLMQRSLSLVGLCVVEKIWRE